MRPHGAASRSTRDRMIHQNRPPVSLDEQGTGFCSFFRRGKRALLPPGKNEQKPVPHMSIESVKRHFSHRSANPGQLPPGLASSNLSEMRFWLILLRSRRSFGFGRPEGFALISLDTTPCVAHISMLRCQAVSLFMFSRSLVACLRPAAFGCSLAHGTAASYLEAHRDPTSKRWDV